MKESDRLILGAVVMCGMLIGAVLATWPSDTPAAPAPSQEPCAAHGPAAAALAATVGRPGDQGCAWPSPP
jgi:hypothetical protein